MRGTPRGWLAGFAALALLAGCAAPPPDAPAATVAPAPAPAPVQAANAPAPGPAAQPETVPVAVPAAPPRRAAAGDLVGLERDRLAGLFGAPVLRRREAPAEVWQYGNGRCVLFVFLYPERDRLMVRHAETAARGPSPLKTDADCIEALLKPGMRPPARDTVAGRPAS